jgi:hypothetical protein
LFKGHLTVRCHCCPSPYFDRLPFEQCNDYC